MIKWCIGAIIIISLTILYGPIILMKFEPSKETYPSSGIEEIYSFEVVTYEVTEEKKSQSTSGTFNVTEIIVKDIDNNLEVESAIYKMSLSGDELGSIEFPVHHD